MTVIDRFLANEDYYRSNMKGLVKDGRGEALQTLNRFIGELARPLARSSSRQAPTASAAATT